MKKIWNWVKDTYSEATEKEPQAPLYVRALIMVTIGLLVGVAFKKIGAYFILTGIALMVLIFITEAYRSLVHAQESTLFKFLFSAFAAALAAISVGFSSQQVAVVTGADPAYFRNSIAIISILNYPIFFLSAVALLSFAFPIFHIVYLPLKFAYREILKLEKHFGKPLAARFWKVEPGDLSTMPMDLFLLFTRVFAVTSLFLMSRTFLLPHLANYEDFYRHALSMTIYELEMYGKTTCVTNLGEKAAYISDGQILVGIKETDGPIRYQVRQCKS